METQTREKSKNPKTGSKSKRKKESVDYTLQRDKAEEERRDFPICFCGVLLATCGYTVRSVTTTTHCMCVCV